MSGVTITVLLVDDDNLTLNGISRNLRHGGYEVLNAKNGFEGIRLTRECRPDVILLDVLMPGIDGFETCRRIREFSAVPILMLTGMGDPRNRVRGLDIGADDYLAKPFSQDELEARIRALLRRSTKAAGALKPEWLEYGELRIDTARHEVSMRGRGVGLTPMEYKLLLTLAENAEKVLEHRELLGTAWGPGYRDDLGYLRVYVRRLRQKIEEHPSQPEYLRTVSRVGYVLGFDSRRGGQVRLGT